MTVRRSHVEAGRAAKPRRRFLTLGIDVAGMSCLVVGGGRVGSRKALALVDHGARVTVCSPEISESLKKSVRSGRLRWNKQTYDSSLLRGVRLVVAATDDRSLNVEISRDAENRRIPCCLASDRGRSKVIFPATCQIEDVEVAVHTNGQSPRRSAEVRDLVNHLLLSRVRQRTSFANPVIPSEPGHVHAGMVYIVGAGPGAADLITVRGLRAIQSADLVIYDRILGNDFAEQLGLDPNRSEIEWLGAGRMSPARQADINRRMLDACTAGKAVARVKNGDPFVFGRGGEEIDFLLAHGIAFETIPGISSALGTLTAAGYAATTRETGRSFAVTSAQLAGGQFNEHYPKADSLIVLMAVGVLERVVSRLVGDGWPPETPAVIIERGTQPGERELAGRLMEIADLAIRSNIESPAILAIGAVAACKHARPRRVCAVPAHESVLKANRIGGS